MKRFIQKYAALLQAHWAEMMIYRSESFIWMLGAFIQPIVSLSVWLSISGDGVVGGFSAADYILYFIGVMFVGRMTGAWDVWGLDNDIRQGTYSAKLLRPFHPVHWSMAGNVVNKVFFAAFMIPAWAILAVFYPFMRPPVSFTIVVLAVLAIIIALYIRFIIGYQIGMLAFWTNRATSIYMLYEGLHLFLSGRIAPLSMFPEWFVRAAEWLPFYVTIGFPVELLMGRMNGDWVAIMKGFSIQLFWMICLTVLFRLQWKQGLKKYGAVGG